MRTVRNCLQEFYETLWELTIKKLYNIVYMIFVYNLVFQEDFQTHFCYHRNNRTKILHRFSSYLFSCTTTSMRVTWTYGGKAEAVVVRIGWQLQNVTEMSRYQPFTDKGSCVWITVQPVGRHTDIIFCTSATRFSTDFTEVIEFYKSLLCFVKLV